MKKVLLVIDVQNEYFTGKLKVTYPDSNVSLANIIKTMDYAKNNNMPIIIVQHTSLSGETFVKGTKEWDIHSDATLIAQSLRFSKVLSTKEWIDNI